MNLLKKMIGIVIIFSLFSIHFPQPCFAWQHNSYKKLAKATTITKHSPEFLAPPELRIPVETKKAKASVKKWKSNKWLWIGAGVVAAGAIAALSGGGGGDGGNDRAGTDAGDGTGSIDIIGPAP